MNKNSNAESLPSLPMNSEQKSPNPPKGKTSLNRQLVVLLLGLAIAFGVLSFATQKLAVLPFFNEIEYESTERDIKRCVAALNRDIELLSNLANDWAAWDDTYEFVEDHNADFEESNLVDESFTGAQLNLIAMFDVDGALVWGDGMDLETEDKLDFSAVYAQFADPSVGLMVFEDLEDSKEGILMTESGPLLIAVRPIITSKLDGPIRGAFVMGRLLTADEIFNLGERAQVDLKVATAQDENLPDTERTLLADSSSGLDGTMIVSAGAEQLHAFTVFPDLFGNPSLVMRVDVPRTITQQGKFAASIAIVSSVLGGLLMVAVAGWLIRRRVIAPVELIAAHANRIGVEGNLKTRLDLARHDEIGELAKAFDLMVEAIAESRRQSLDIAHRAGMADVASEVLHNVGNTLNSANASLEKLEEGVNGSKLEGLKKANELLQSQAECAGEFFEHDERAPKLIDYFAKVTDSLEQGAANERVCLTRLRETICHIQEIITQQQASSRLSGFVQEVDLDKLIEEVVGFNQELIGNLGVEVNVQVEGRELSLVDKGKLSQVLLNLVRNAIEAMSEQDGPRQLTIIAATTNETGLGIEVRDTGEGVSESNQSSLFNQGFTTKANGNGIGLHYCANAVQSMGGKIRFHSDGPGRGATCLISLPNVLPIEDGESAPNRGAANSMDEAPFDGLAS